MTELIGDHQAHTQRSAQVVVADSKYGVPTTANFLDCYDRGVMAHIPVLKQTQDKQERRSKIFAESKFVYNCETDTYTCPAGQPLRRRKHWVERKAFEYVTSRGVCQQCALRLQCTHSQSAGRTIKRHERQLYPLICENLFQSCHPQNSSRTNYLVPGPSDQTLLRV